MKKIIMILMILIALFLNCNAKEFKMDSNVFVFEEGDLYYQKESFNGCVSYEKIVFDTGFFKDDSKIKKVCINDYVIYIYKEKSKWRVECFGKGFIYATLVYPKVVEIK